MIVIDRPLVIITFMRSIRFLDFNHYLGGILWWKLCSHIRVFDLKILRMLQYRISNTMRQKRTLLTMITSGHYQLFIDHFHRQFRNHCNHFDFMILSIFKQSLPHAAVGRSVLQKNPADGHVKTRRSTQHSECHSIPCKSV